MILSDVRDMIASLGIAEDDNCYMHKLDNKKQKCIRVYFLKRDGNCHIPIGGIDNATYGVYPVSLLVHWNKNPIESEKAATELYKALLKLKDLSVNEYTIKFISLLVPCPQYVSTDSNGAHEWVIEGLIYYEQGGNK